MNLEARAVLEYQIGKVLRRYEIGATDVTLGKGGRATAYVIWDRRAHPMQVFASLSLAEARDELVRLQTAALTQLFEETKCACPAD